MSRNERGIDNYRTSNILYFVKALRAFPVYDRQTATAPQKTRHLPQTMLMVHVRPLEPVSGPLAVSGARSIDEDDALKAQRIQGSSATAANNAQQPKHGALLASSIIFLILLLTLGGALYSTGILGSTATGTNGTGPVQGPAVAATALAALVTITPENTDFKQSYIITEVTSNPDATQNQVGGTRTITSSSSQSSSMAATGRQQTNGTRATGTLRLFQPSQVITIPAGTEFSGGGVTVATSYAVSLRPRSRVTVGAYALQTGSRGNIPAYAINTSGSRNGVAFDVQNPGAFSGGSDGQSYHFVRQGDIDGVAQTLTGQATQVAQSALGTQLQANEQFIGDKQCTSQTSASPPPGAQASSVTVTVEATCTTQVYDPQPALAMAPTLLKRDLLQRLGANYIIVGSIYTTTTYTAVVGTAVSISIDAEAVTVFQFTDTQLKNIASLLTNQDQQSARTFLSHKPGILTFTIKLTGGDEQTFPGDAQSITIEVEQIRGL